MNAAVVIVLPVLPPNENVGRSILSRNFRAVSVFANLLFSSGNVKLHDVMRKIPPLSVRSEAMRCG